MNKYTITVDSLNLTQEEKTLYSKIRSGQRSSGLYLMSSVEHHSEQEILRGLITKMQDKTPFSLQSATDNWIATSLKTQTVIIKRFEKKYPRVIETTIPVQTERLSMLEARVAYLEAEMRRVYDLQNDVHKLEDMQRYGNHTPRERRSYDRPRSPAYSPYAPPSTPPVFGSHTDSRKW